MTTTPSVLMITLRRVRVALVLCGVASLGFGVRMGYEAHRWAQGAIPVQAEVVAVFGDAPERRATLRWANPDGSISRTTQTADDGAAVGDSMPLLVSRLDPTEARRPGLMGLWREALILGVSGLVSLISGLAITVVLRRRAGQGR